MSTTADASPDPDWNWDANRARLYGWLTGVAIMVFGGLICSVALGLILGLPTVAFGLFLAVTFAISMSGAPVRTPAALAIFVCGLALTVGGRGVAPVSAIVESFREGRSLDRIPGILNVLGLPMLLAGVSLVAISVQWLRLRTGVGRFRRGLGLLLIHGGALILLAGALFSTGGRRYVEQPGWAWLAVPLLLGLGTALRVGPRGRLWILVMGLSAAALPLTWLLLIARTS